MLELDDGTFIGESVSITRYLDAIGEGPSLFGDGPLAQAQIDMWQRRAEFNFLLEVAGAFRNITGFFKDRETCVEAWGVVCAERAPKALTMFDDQLAQVRIPGRRSIFSSGYHARGRLGLCSLGEGGRVARTAEYQALAGRVEGATEFFGELANQNDLVGAYSSVIGIALYPAASNACCTELVASGHRAIMEPPPPPPVSLAPMAPLRRAI